MQICRNAQQNRVWRGRRSLSSPQDGSVRLADRTGTIREGRAGLRCVRYSIHLPKMECGDRSEYSLGEILLPLIDKYLPTLYALLFQNTSLEPGVVLHFLSHFIFIFRVED